MQQEHLGIEDYERYLNTSDMSEEYLLWYEKKAEHLDNCAVCQRFLNRMLQVEAVCEDEVWSHGLAFLEKEEEIRSKLLAQKLILAGQAEKMQEVITLLCMNKMENLKVYKKDFLRKQSVARGVVNTEGVNGAPAMATKMKVAYAEGKIQVKVLCKEPKDFTVILQPEPVTQADPLVGQALWSAEDGAAIAEFEAGTLEETYHIYLA